MLIREINTYTERDDFILENEKLGFCDSDFIDYDIDIWTCELYKNRQTGKYSLFITRDSDEQWLVCEFE